MVIDACVQQEQEVGDRSNISRAVGVYRQEGSREIKKIKKVSYVCTNCPSGTLLIPYVPGSYHALVMRYGIRCLFLVVLTSGLVSCYRRNDVEMPFSPATGFVYTELSSKDRRAGLTGDGFLVRRWLVNGKEEDLISAIAPLSINKRLAWLTTEDMRFVEVFVFLSRFNEMSEILPEVQAALKSPKTRIGFEEIISSERGVEACSVWIIDPSTRVLWFLNAKG